MIYILNFTSFYIFLPPELLRLFYPSVVPFLNHANISVKPSHQTRRAIKMKIFKYWHIDIWDTNILENIGSLILARL